MFTRIFRSDYIFQLIFLVIISLIVWIKPFMSADISYFPQNAPLYDLIKLLLEGNPLLKIILSFTLLILQSLLLKRTFSSNELTSKNSLLPAFLYVILMSSFGNFQNIQPLIFANLFLIIVLKIILSIYSNPESYEQIFMATFLISLGSLFYFPVFFFILFIWMVFLIFSLLKWREWLISILGFSIPYLFLFSYYYLTDIFDIKMLSYKLFFKKADFHLPHFSVLNLVFFCVLSIVFVFSLISSSSRLNERSIFYRKKIIVLIMFLIISVLTLFFSKDNVLIHLCLLFIPVSFFISNYLTQFKKLFVSEIIYLLLFIVWLYNYLGN